MSGCIIRACLKQHRVDERFLSASKLYFSSLEKPTVLFQDNHLLAVNKPVGWHSVPNPGPASPKCLLSELKRMELGGGSHKDFLLSLHRIDQPCSGVMLFAKTSKAASRVTAIWKKKLVQKQYICVVSGDRIEKLQNRSLDTSSDWYSMEGQVSPNMKNHRSVMIRPIDSQSAASGQRQVSIEWKLLGVNSTMPKFQMIMVKTNDGSRHMVRALLAQVGGCPIQGDLRYNAATVPLTDQSVALHAFRLSLDPTLKLGGVNVFDFEAPIPKTWGHFFGISNENAVFL
jgi:23S rRNA pseudouridine1911/1915/1917 synthase